MIVFVLPETGSRPHPISEITGDTEKAVTEGSRWEADTVTEGSRWEADTGMRKQYYYLHWDGDVTSSDPEFYTGNVIYGLISTPAMLSTDR